MDAIKCIIIGSSKKVGETAELLKRSKVSTKVIADIRNYNEVLTTCGNARSLEVIVVFCNDFPDGGLDFILQLRNQFRMRAHILVLKEGAGDAHPTDATLVGMGVKKVFSWVSLSPDAAALAIKKECFPAAL